MNMKEHLDKKLAERQRHYGDIFGNLPKGTKIWNTVELTVLWQLRSIAIPVGTEITDWKYDSESLTISCRIGIKGDESIGMPSMVIQTKDLNFYNFSCEPVEVAKKLIG